MHAWGCAWGRPAGHCPRSVNFTLQAALSTHLAITSFSRSRILSLSASDMPDPTLSHGYTVQAVHSNQWTWERSQVPCE